MTALGHLLKKLPLYLKLAGRALTLSGALGTLAFLLYASQPWKQGVQGLGVLLALPLFAAWNLVPYVVLWLVLRKYAESLTQIAVACACALMTTSFAFYVLIADFLAHPLEVNRALLVVLPFYLLPPGLLALGICRALARRPQGEAAP